MKSSTLFLALAFVFLSNVASSQHQPYAGLQARLIKALSDEQVSDLKAGRGMGLALVAELNGYPGPSHVLELADKLALSADQRAKVQRLFDSMKAEALPIGAKLIEQETELDRLFASRSIAPDSRQRFVRAVGERHRARHLGCGPGQAVPRISASRESKDP
jgi:hypothetical protein